MAVPHPSSLLGGSLTWVVVSTGIVLALWRLLSIGMRPKGYPPGLHAPSNPPSLLSLRS